MNWTPRYSVCTDTEPPKELHSTNDRQAALTERDRLITEGVAAVVYDWTIGTRVDA
jgi:hypothetical protein